MKFISCAVAYFLVSLFFAGELYSQQTGTLRGILTDAETGEPLPFATISLTPTGGGAGAKKFGAISKADGSYIVRAAPGTYTVRATYVTYLAHTSTVTVEADQETTLNIQLRYDPKGQEEIVVTGLAEERFKSQSEVAVSRIQAAELLESNSYQDLSQLVAGKAAGVRALPSSGNAGGGTRFDVRSGAGLFGSGQPVLYIDGVRIANSELSPDLVGGQFFSTLADINPNDIESINILKGPAAAALYGTSGANGVILIKTRKGQLSGISAAPNYEYHVTFGENQQAQEYTPDMLTYEDANAIFRKGPFVDHTIQLSGGAESFTYFSSFSKRNEDGIMPNNSFDRNSVRANFRAFPSEKVTLTATANYIASTTTLPQNDNNLLGYLGNTVILGPSFGGSYAFLNRPAIDAINTTNEAGRFLGSLEFHYTPIDFLVLQGTFGYDAANYNITQIYPAAHDYSSVAITRGRRHVQYIATDRTNFDLSAGYTWGIGENMSGTTTVGTQLFYNTQKGALTTKEDFTSGLISNIGAGGKLIAADEEFADLREAGIFLTQDFAIDETYLFSFGVRNDFASSIVESAPSIFYPRASAAVLLNKLDILPESFNVFKVRVGYGQSGTLPGPLDGSDVLWRGTISGHGTGATIASIGNPLIEPERINELELGLDFEISNAYGLEFTYYMQTAKQSIVDFLNAPSTGFTATSVPKNVGSIEGSGFETMIYATPVRTADYQLDLNLILNYTTNEVTDLGSAPPIFQDQNALVVGQPRGAFYDFQVLGAAFDETTGAYTGARVDSVRSFMGNPVSPHSGSFSVNFRFLKNFEVYGLVDWALGGTIHNLTRTFQTQLGNDREYNMLLDQLGEQDLDTLAAPLDVGSPAYRAAAERFAQLDFAQPGATGYFESTDNLRVREVSLSYDFSELLASWLPNRQIKSCKLSLGARNVALFKKYSAPDVEVNYVGASRSISRGQDFLTLQNPRVIYGSISIGF